MRKLRRNAAKVASNRRRRKERKIKNPASEHIEKNRDATKVRMRDLRAARKAKGILEKPKAARMARATHSAQTKDETTTTELLHLRAKLLCVIQENKANGERITAMEAEKEQMVQ